MRLKRRSAARFLVYGLWSMVYGLVSSGCGYTARPGLQSSLRTVYVKSFTNKIDITQIGTGASRYPIYRPRIEVDITNAVTNRFQFSGLLRPASRERADCRLEGELVEFRRDALRFNPSQDVEEWRLNVVVNLSMIDQKSQEVLWEEWWFTGDTTYFAVGPKTESEPAALDRAITDLAKRIVERSVDNW